MAKAAGRDDLVLIYFAEVEPAGTLAALEMVPLQVRNFQLIRPSQQDIRRMEQTLDRESRKFGAGVALNPGGRLAPSWNQAT